MEKPQLTPKQEAFARAVVETGNQSEAYRMAYDVAPPVIPKGCYVYVLVDSITQRILYVGKGTGSRMHHHLRDARNGRVSGVKKFSGLVQALADGDLIEPVCIEDGLSSHEALRFERHLIWKIGHANLWNAVAGQTTSAERALVKAKWLVARLESQFEFLSGERLEMAMRFRDEAVEAVEMAAMAHAN